MTRTFATAGIVAAMLVPSAFAADPVPADYKNAAKYCKALRTSKGVGVFGAEYGTNANKMNAFGKCVSTTAKAKAKKREAASDAAEDAAEAKATATCKKQQAENATKFAQEHKNFGQCVKAEKAKTSTT